MSNFNVAIAKKNFYLKYGTKSLFDEEKARQKFVQRNPKQTNDGPKDKRTNKSNNPKPRTSEHRQDNVVRGNKHVVKHEGKSTFSRIKGKLGKMSVKMLEELPMLFLKMIASNYKTFNAHKLSLPKEEQPAFKKMFQDMVIGEVGDEPVFELRSPLTTVYSSVGPTFGEFIPVVAINPSTLIGIATIADMFDEMKFEGPVSVIYIPLVKQNSLDPDILAIAVGVIDYTDATILTSQDQALAFETHKIFNTEQHPGITHPIQMEWPVRLQGQPDLQWIDAGASLIVAWWKAFTLSDSFPNISLNTGAIQWSGKFKFRVYNAVV